AVPRRGVGVGGTLRGGEPVGHGAGARGARRADGHPERARRTRGQRGGLLRRPGDRHHADDGAAAGRGADVDPHSGDVGGRAVLLREGARPAGVGLPAGQRRLRAHGHQPAHRGGAPRGGRGVGDPQAAGERRTGHRRQAARRTDGGPGGQDGDRKRVRAPLQRLQAAADAQPGETRNPRVGRWVMDLLTWGRSPWGEWVLTHVSWSLFWASLYAGILFFLAHASYMLFSAHRKRPSAETDRLEAANKDLPEKIVRHTLAARLFHWVMAASMFVLLFTAFLPI